MSKILVFLAATLFVLITIVIWSVSFDRIQLYNANITSVENSEGSQRLAEAEARLYELYHISRENVLFLADLVEMDMQNGVSTQHTSGILARFLKSHYGYFQARWIDPDGHEKIRLEDNGEGVINVGNEDLQDKEARYYFQETIDIDEDEVYISYLDLNVERGRVEVPYRPTIRFFTPIYENKKLKGVIGLNLNAQTWLKSFSSKGIFLLNSRDQVFLGDEEDLYKVSTVDLDKKDTHNNDLYLSKKVSLEGNHEWQLYTSRDVAAIQEKKNNYRNRIYWSASVLSAGSLLFLVIVFTFYKKNREISGLNRAVESSLQERSTLLREIHHRVKNNLQVITSLLSLQSSFVEDEATKGLLRYSQYRIKSMAMVHEMLYQNQNLSRINYGDYLHRLVSALVFSMKGTKSGIELQIEADNVFLNVDTSIPLALMVNEIITNSLKYGLRDKPGGILSISVSSLEYPNFIMRIGDNGKGFPDDITFRNTKSLGLKLIHKLVLQLRGNIEKDNMENGTHYIITFQEIEQKS